MAHPHCLKAMQSVSHTQPSGQPQSRMWRGWGVSDRSGRQSWGAARSPCRATHGLSDGHVCSYYAPVLQYCCRAVLFGGIRMRAHECSRQPTGTVPRHTHTPSWSQRKVQLVSPLRRLNASGTSMPFATHPIAYTQTFYFYPLNPRHAATQSQLLAFEFCEGARPWEPSWRAAFLIQRSFCPFCR